MRCLACSPQHLGWVRLPFPVLTIDHRGRRVVTQWVPCDECIGGIASCCEGAGAAGEDLHAARAGARPASTG